MVGTKGHSGIYKHKTGGHNSPKTEFKKGHKINLGKTPWNKGKNIRINTGRTHFKKGQFGEKAGHWKGGITSLRNLIRSSNKYKKWRSDVFERDNWTCQTCGNRGRDIEAHHNKEFWKILKENNIKTLKQAMKCEELWDLNNGVTLCKECHKLTKKGREI